MTLMISPSVFLCEHHEFSESLDQKAISSFIDLCVLSQIRITLLCNVDML